MPSWKTKIVIYSWKVKCSMSKYLQNEVGSQKWWFINDGILLSLLSSILDFTTWANRRALRDGERVIYLLWNVKSTFLIVLSILEDFVRMEFYYPFWILRSIFIFIYIILDFTTWANRRALRDGEWIIIYCEMLKSTFMIVIFEDFVTMEF